MVSVVSKPGARSPTPPPNPLTPDQQTAIKKIAEDSEIADYDWEDRGEASYGYTAGMALAFATTLLKLRAGHPAAVEMAKARTNSDKDVFDLWRNEFDDEGMPNEASTPADVRLRHLYAF